MLIADGLMEGMWNSFSLYSEADWKRLYVFLLFRWFVIIKNAHAGEKKGIGQKKPGCHKLPV